MKIDINKKYRYRDGEPARILCVDAPGCYPVVSICPRGDVFTHTLTGSQHNGSSGCAGDLIEVREPREWEITCYEDGSMQVNIGGLKAPRGETIRVREIID
jgi:hypothetical protein